MERPTTREELRLAIQQRVDEIITLAENYGDEYVNIEVGTSSVYISESEDWSASWESSDASC